MLKRENVTDLSGTWKFIIDRDDAGGERGFTDPALDRTFWREAEIPCTFEGAAPEATGYRGTVWFCRRFTVQEKPAAFLWLAFASVNYRADVWINGRFVGTHVGGYLPFRFEISGAVVPGENFLCVRVNGRVIPGMLPPSHFWRGHGGILRAVSLYETPACRIGSVRVRRDGAAVRITATAVNGTAEGMTVRIRHLCPENGLSAEDELFVPAHGEAVSETDLPADAFTPWEPDSPALYTCETELTAEGVRDACAVSFGVRELRAEDGKILLNGKEIRLRGFDRHEDSPDRQLAADAANAERDFRIMKEMGANFVRFCHYPHSEEELDLCDRLGLLVLAEIPLNAPMVAIREYDAAQTERALPQTYVSAREAAREMIKRDYNHPSIAFWSVSNESNESVPQLRQMNDALIRYVKALDGSRFAVHVSQGCWWADRSIAGQLFAEDDVICINAYVTMEHLNGKPAGEKSVTEEDRRYAEAFWERQTEYFRTAYPGKPIVVTEFGYPTGKITDGILDEERQADAVLCDMAAMEGRIAGYAIWHFADHEWEITEDGGVFFGSRISPYGIFRRDRTPKGSAAVIAGFWKQHNG